MPVSIDNADKGTRSKGKGKGMANRELRRGEERLKVEGSRLKVQGERIVIVKAEGRWTTAALGRGTRKTHGERGKGAFGVGRKDIGESVQGTRCKEKGRHISV